MKKKAPEHFDRMQVTFQVVNNSPGNPMDWVDFKEKTLEQLRDMESFVQRNKLSCVYVELVESSGYGDDPYNEFEIRGISPWSEKKIQKHNEKQAIEEAQKKQVEEDREREEYLRLSKKFSGTNPGVRQRS